MELQSEIPKHQSVVVEQILSPVVANFPVAVRKLQVVD
jgi:hypothetical protein